MFKDDEAASAHDVFVVSRLVISSDQPALTKVIWIVVNKCTKSLFACVVMSFNNLLILCTL